MSDRCAILPMDDLIEKVAALLRPHIGIVADVQDNTQFIEMGVEYFCFGRPPVLKTGYMLPAETSMTILQTVVNEIALDITRAFGVVWPARVYRYEILDGDLKVMEVEPHVYLPCWGDNSDE